LTRFAENVFLDNYTSTIGIDFNSRMIRVNGAICKLEIWDTAGQERFSTITANYYRGAQGALLVYDVGIRETLDHVKSWHDRAKQLGGQDIEMILVGNKADIADSARSVTWDDGDAMATSLGIQFIETSALSGENIEAAFLAMASTIKESVDKRGLTGVKASTMEVAGGVVLSTGERKTTLKERCGCN
jgi:small GTP-binding protein